MSQPGFFDLDDRYSKLDGLGDPLVRVAGLVSWEVFRPVLERALAKPRKSNAGRKEYDRVLMFKILVLQQLYNLSDDQTEFQIRDRYSFCRFLGLKPEDRVPDAKTIWRFRENLGLGGAIEELFEELSLQIEAQGYRARKRRHKDVDARWTKKHGVSEYGYKNHVSVDRAHGLVRRYEVTDAARHDSQVFEQLLDETNTSGDVWADSAYRSKEHEQMLAKAGYRSRIHRKAQRNRPLSARSLNANRKRSRVRARVEPSSPTRRA